MSVTPVTFLFKKCWLGQQTWVLSDSGSLLAWSRAVISILAALCRWHAAAVERQQSLCMKIQTLNTQYCDPCSPQTQTLFWCEFCPRGLFWGLSWTPLAPKEVERLTLWRPAESLELPSVPGDDAPCWSKCTGHSSPLKGCSFLQLSLAC